MTADPSIFTVDKNAIFDSWVSAVHLSSFSWKEKTGNKWQKSFLTNDFSKVSDFSKNDQMIFILFHKC
jgi:hypothetical protein